MAGLIAVMVLCGAVFVLVPPIAGPVNVIMAEKLPGEPEEFVVLAEPDAVMLEAISTLEPVEFGSYDETQFDELAGSEHGAVNVEYQGSYYFVGAPFVEPAQSYSLTAWVALSGLITSIALLIAIAIYKIRNTKGEK